MPRVVVGQHQHVGVGARDAGADLALEAVHDREHGEQRGHADGDADDRERGEDGDERGGTPRAQIAGGDPESDVHARVERSSDAASPGTSASPAPPDEAAGNRITSRIGAAVGERAWSGDRCRCPGRRWAACRTRGRAGSLCPCGCASSSPPSRARRCRSKAALCASGSFCSVNALPISMPATNGSKRSTSLRIARGSPWPGARSRAGGRARTSAARARAARARRTGRRACRRPRALGSRVEAVALAQAREPRRVEIGDVLAHRSSAPPRACETAPPRRREVERRALVLDARCRRVTAIAALDSPSPR